MAESRTALLRRLKAQRRKAGIGEFSKRKKRSKRASSRARPRRASNRRVVSMAKKKTVKRSNMFGGLNKPLMAGITYGIAQPIVSQQLQRFNIGLQDELVQIIFALLAKRFTRNSLVTNYANAAIIVSTAQLTQGVVQGGGLGGLFGGGSSGSSSTSSTSGSGGGNF